ncbi:DNA/RNA non-specific endonuclease [Flavobacterium sp.]|uniref:DNA/RNA non-specific endonuclease n=1 Tax=Flavobacterium sp. TaxID=239 RepID=UPI0039E71850
MRNIGFLILFGVLLNCQQKQDREPVSQGLASRPEPPIPPSLLQSTTTNQLIVHDSYVLSYNEKYEQAEWVAYELKAADFDQKTNFKRPFFVQDPKVKTGSADWRNYKKSGFDKGHLCPAGDRKYSKKAFEETFYTSNISPQRHGFNDGIWNRLEQKTRYWAQKNGKLIVITGGVLNEHLPTIGNEKVAVPAYFYKIIRDDSKGKTKLIAFLVPHQPSDRPLYEFVVPVDWIEKKTGIDFCRDLPDAIENELEKNADYKAWSF